MDSSDKTLFQSSAAPQLLHRVELVHFCQLVVWGWTSCDKTQIYNSIFNLKSPDYASDALAHIPVYRSRYESKSVRPSQRKPNVDSNPTFSGVDECWLLYLFLCWKYICLLINLFNSDQDHAQISVSHTIFSSVDEAALKKRQHGSNQATHWCVVFAYIHSSYTLILHVYTKYCT